MMKNGAHKLEEAYVIGGTTHSISTCPSRFANAERCWSESLSHTLTSTLRHACHSSTTNSLS